MEIQINSIFITLYFNGQSLWYFLVQLFLHPLSTTNKRELKSSWKLQILCFFPKMLVSEWMCPQCHLECELWKSTGRRQLRKLSLEPLAESQGLEPLTSAVALSKQMEDRAWLQVNCQGTWNSQGLWDSAQGIVLLYNSDSDDGS